MSTPRSAEIAPAGAAIPHGALHGCSGLPHAAPVPQARRTVPQKHALEKSSTRALKAPAASPPALAILPSPSLLHRHMARGPSHSGPTASRGARRHILAKIAPQAQRGTRRAASAREILGSPRETRQVGSHALSFPPTIPGRPFTPVPAAGSQAFFNGGQIKLKSCSLGSLVRSRAVPGLVLCGFGALVLLYHTHKPEHWRVGIPVQSTYRN
jgi:hypothetical protein